VAFLPDVLPNPYEVYIGLEASAASIRNFEPVVVPGLLQTSDCARDLPERTGLGHQLIDAERARYTPPVRR
jgi:hypothetical protein